jgi:hypothetical protein
MKRFLLASALSLALLAARAPRPEPPAPLPTMSAAEVAAPEYVVWLPVVAQTRNQL